MRPSLSGGRRGVSWPGDEKETAACVRRSAARIDPFGRNLHLFAEVGSTSDEIVRLADQGAPHGTVVVARAQPAGRGRHGNRWFSPSGSGLYLSALLRKPLAPLLTLVTGVVVAETLREVVSLPVELEWPNDVVVMVDGQRRKVAGILAENATVRADGDSSRVVVGIGINLADGAWPTELSGQAASVAGLTGVPVDADLLLVEVLAALASSVDALARGDTLGLCARWSRLAPSSAGTRVTWSGPQGRAEGTTVGIDADGALLVRTEHGIERLTGGEVRHLRREKNQ